MPNLWTWGPLPPRSVLHIDPFNTRGRSFNTACSATATSQRGIFAPTAPSRHTTAHAVQASPDAPHRPLLPSPKQRWGRVSFQNCAHDSSSYRPAFLPSSLSPTLGSFGAPFTGAEMAHLHPITAVFARHRHGLISRQAPPFHMTSASHTVLLLMDWYTSTTASRTVRQPFGLAGSQSHADGIGVTCTCTHKLPVQDSAVSP